MSASTLPEIIVASRFSDDNLELATGEAHRQPGRRVTIDETQNQVHFTFGSRFYDRRWSEDEDATKSSVQKALADSSNAQTCVLVLGV